MGYENNVLSFSHTSSLKSKLMRVCVFVVVKKLTNNGHN